MSTTDMTLHKAWIEDRDAEAMATIIRQYSSMVFGTCMRILANKDDAQDVAQECFIKLAEVKSVDSSLAGLLHRMATNQSINKIRSEGRRRTREKTYVESQDESYEIAWDDVQHFVDEAIAELPEETRDAIVRAFFVGDTHEAIAQDEGVTRAAISYRIKRGIESIRTNLDKRGVAVGATALGSMLMTQVAQAAPATLTSGLIKLALAGASGTARVGVTATGATWAGGSTLIKWAAVAAVVIGIPTITLMKQDSVVPPVIEEEIVEEIDLPVQNDSADLEPEVVSTTPDIQLDQVTSSPSIAPEMQAYLESLGVEDLSAEDLVYGTFFSGTGHPRSSVEIFPASDLYAYSRVEDSRLQGYFVIEDVKPEERTWIAQSRPTRRATLFTVPDSSAARKSMSVTLDMYKTEMIGHIVTADGQGVPKAHLAVRVLRSNGEEYIIQTPEGMFSRTNGYYQVRLATEAEAQVSVGILSPGTSDVAFWSEAITTKAEAYHFEFPKIVIPDELAELIAQKSKVPARYKKYVNEVPRARYGGIVVDETGQAIEGVLLALSFSSKPGFSDSGLAVSGADGRWVTYLPAQMDSVRVRAQHPDYIDTKLTRSRSVKLPIGRLKDESSELVLQRGVKVHGYVRDEQGNGVADALIDPDTVTSYATTDLGSIPTENQTTARTNAEGFFELNCLPEGKAEILVLAQDYAPAAVSIEVFDEMNETIIEVDEGATIRGQFLDEEGNPLEYAYLYSSDWKIEDPTSERGKKHRVNIRAETNAEGWFELHNVPREGSIRYTLGQRGTKRGTYVSMSATLEPREEPYEIILYAPPVIHGKVVDDETGEAITSFTVNGGWKWENSDTFSFDRMGRATDVNSEDGSFTKLISGMSVSYPPTIPFAVHVSAKGYHSAITPEYRLGDSDEPFTVRLKRGEPWAGTVVNADGAPVSGVLVAQIQPDERAHIQNGRLRFDYSNSPSNKMDTLADGSFSLPPTLEHCGLLAIHKTGYAFLESEGNLEQTTITLTPWAKVQGTIFVEEAIEGSTSSVGMQVMGATNQMVNWMFEDALHTDGTYEFDFVPAIPFVITHHLNVSGRSQSLGSVEVSPEPNDLLEANIGE